MGEIFLSSTLQSRLADSIIFCQKSFRHFYFLILVDRELNFKSHYWCNSLRNKQTNKNHLQGSLKGKKKKAGGNHQCWLTRDTYLHPRCLDQAWPPWKAIGKLSSENYKEISRWSQVVHTIWVPANPLTGRKIKITGKQTLVKSS